MKNIYVISFLLFFLLADSLHAQRKRGRYDTFGGGLLFGVNISQMDGDYFTGFDKAGFYAGLRGVVYFSSQWSLNMELLYSQKGSKIPHGTFINNREVRDRSIELNYAEVPILFKLMLTPLKNSSFLEFGGSFSKLIKANIQEKSANLIRGTIYRDISVEFQSFDFNAVVGLGFKAGEHLEFGFRYNFGVNRFYKNEDFVLPSPLSGKPKEVEFLRNYYISLFAAYQFR